MALAMNLHSLLCFLKSGIFTLKGTTSNAGKCLTVYTEKGYDVPS